MRCYFSLRSLPEVFSMSADRRSRIFRTLLLALAVLFSQTAHAAKPVRQLTPGTAPSFLKLSSARPEGRKDLGVASRKLQRPGRKTQDHSLFSVAGLLPVMLADFEASRQTVVAVRLGQQQHVASPSRLFVLRV
jgi:hypothetical protein